MMAGGFIARMCKPETAAEGFIEKGWVMKERIFHTVESCIEKSKAVRSTKQLIASAAGRGLFALLALVLTGWTASAQITVESRGVQLRWEHSEKGYQLIPGHDPHVWPELTQHFHDRFGPVES